MVLWTHWMILFSVIVSGTRKAEGGNATVRECVSSPIEYNKPSVLVFHLPENPLKTVNPVHIMWKGFHDQKFDHVLDHVWNITTHKHDIYTKNGYVFGGVQDVTMFLIINTTTPEYAGTYTMETADPADTRNCTLQVNLPVKTVHLNLNSQKGVLEVNESEATDVVFECSADPDTSSPDLTVNDEQGRELARLNGITGKPSVLTHRMRNVRCENNAVYTCNVLEGGVKLQEYSRRLKVLCVMRVERGSVSCPADGQPVLDAREGQGKLSFNLLTTEIPRTYGFLHLGSAIKDSGTPPRYGLFNVDCEKTAILYKCECTITASSATEAVDGYYNLTMSTSLQSVSFTFYLQVKEIEFCTEKTEPSSTGCGTVCLIGLCCASLACLCTAFVVIFFLWKKRILYCAGSLSGWQLEMDLEATFMVHSTRDQDIGERQRSGAQLRSADREDRDLRAVGIQLQNQTLHMMAIHGDEETSSHEEDELPDPRYSSTSSHQSLARGASLRSISRFPIQEASEEGQFPRVSLEFLERTEDRQRPQARDASLGSNTRFPVQEASEVTLMERREPFAETLRWSDMSLGTIAPMDRREPIAETRGWSDMPLGTDQMIHGDSD